MINLNSCLKRHPAKRYGGWNLQTVIAGIGLVTTLAVSGCKQSPPFVDDVTLTQALRTKLSSDPALRSEPIQTSVRDRVVTLGGLVSSEAARSLAANDAGQVTGVQSVINNLVVQPTVAVASMSLPPAQQVKSPKVPRREKPTARFEKPVALSSRSSIDLHAPASPVAKPEIQSEPAAPVVRVERPVEAAPSPLQTISLPTGSTLAVRVDETLDSATAQPGDSFRGSLATDIVIDGLVVLADGTPVSGRVDAVQEAAHFKGSSLLTIELTSINRKGHRLPVATDVFTKAGNGRGKNSAEKIGGGAAVGAILGGIFGGGKGAAIGAAAGGGAGAGVQAITKGQQVQIPAETVVRFHLTSSLPVTIPGGEQSKQGGDLQRHD